MTRRIRTRAVLLATLLALSVLAIGGLGAVGGVAAAEDERTLVDYADEETDAVETDGLREAIDDWREGTIETDLLRDVIDAWRHGEPVEAEGGTIEGTVTDDEGEPVANAAIVERDGEVLATTDDDGTYTANVDAGSLTLYATADGYYDASQDTVSVGEGETVSGVDFELAGIVPPDPGEIDGATLEQGEQYTVSTDLDASGEFTDDADYTVQGTVMGPDSDPVDVTTEEDIEVKEIFIPTAGVTVDEVIEDNVEEGVFYPDLTVTGEELNFVDGEQTVEVTIAVDEEAETGDYTLEATLVEFDDDASASETQAVRTVGSPVTATFEVVER